MTAPDSKKLLIFCDANFLAHVSRCVEIAKVLRRDYGYRIVIAGDGKFMKLPKSLGFETDCVFTVPGERTLEVARRAGFVSYNWWNRVCVKSIWSDVECIKRQKPDAVLGDMHWSARTACEMQGIPYISITNAHWTNYFSVRIKALQDHLVTRLLGRKRADKFIPVLKDGIGRYYVLPYLNFRKKHGLDTSKYRNILSLTEGELTLMADIPEYGPTENLPDSFKYVGPIMWEPDMDLPEWYDKLDPERPVFYFTMGSTGYTRFFNQAIQIFGDTEYQVIITTGGLFLDVDRIPSNCFIEEFAPGRAIMEKSDAVVNHGGNGTVYQAVTAGTPLVGIPYHLDQEINLQRVEDLGFGFMISEKHCNSATLLNALQKLVRDPSYRENAKKLRASVDSYDGPALGARYIDEFISH